MAKGTLTLSGVGNSVVSNNPNSVTSSAIATTTINNGNGGDIDIQSQDLIVEGGAAISTRSFVFSRANPYPTGQSGNITLKVAGTTTIRGYVSQVGVILVSTATPGNAGQLILNTGQLNLTGGGRIAAQSEAEGNGGNIVISASQGILLSGQGLNIVVPPPGQLPSSELVISPSQVTATTKAIGQAGNITIQTPQLQVEQGAEISVSTFGSGNGGNLGINSDRLTVNDQGKLLATSTLQGQAGNVTIQAQQVQLDRQGVLAVSSTGEGDAGNLTLQAENLTLNHQSQIIAETTAGQGGNINLDLQNLLLLRNQSLISATAGVEGGGGNGGNIDINARFVVAFPKENSDIIANAYTGTGGNILINALGIYGLDARTTLTPLSDITASSTFGQRGTISLNRLDLDPQSGLLKLEDQVIDPRQLVLQTCSPGGSFTEGTFTISGRGGLPPNPTENWEVNTGLTTLGSPGTSPLAPKSESSSVVFPASAPSPDFVEAQTWQKDAQGRIVLIATVMSPPIRTGGGCDGGLSRAH
jgi:large exoprotein involved in heme utilization and adhesion